MYVFQLNGQLSIEEFYVPFGGRLDPNNRWVELASIISWEPLESRYAPFFAPILVHRPSLSGWPLGRCTSRRDLGSRIVSVELITETPYLQFFIGLSGYEYLRPPFDSSLMVHFRKSIGPGLIKACNQITKANGIAMIQGPLASSQEDGHDVEDKDLEAIETTSSFPCRLTASFSHNWKGFSTIS